MATKSDFAQKLLHDLRIRKERMAASSTTQHSSNGWNSTRGSNGGNIVSAYKGSPQNKTYEYFGLTSTAPNNNKTKSFQFENASNYELVPYTKSKTNTKCGIPVLNFLQEIGKRSLGNGKIEIKSNFGKNSNSDSHIITFSQVHINEISKGIQNLNRILKNCSKGINLDSYSKNVGNELLKGAVDLEQSLRMLANLNEASVHMIKTRGKNRIKLLEDNEDYDDDDDDGNKNVRSNDLKQIERPRFSFDKPNNSKNSRHGSKKIIKNQPLALTYLEETQQQNPSIHSRSISMDLDAENERISSRPQPKNPRTSNVIAKLMGLDDLPRKDESKVIKVDKQQEIKIIQIDQDHGNKILNQETEKEDNNKDETKHVSKIKHEKPGNRNNLQQKVRKIDVSEEKRNLQHLKQKSLIRDSKQSQQERLDKSKPKTCLRVSENKQANKKTIEKQVQGNRPKLIFNKRHGLDNATSETNEMKNSKRGRIQHRKKTDASVNQNEIVLKSEQNTIVTKSMEKQQLNDKNVRISGLAKQETSNNSYLQNPSQKPSLCADDIDIKPKKSSLHQIKGDHEIKVIEIQIFENEQTKQSPLLSDDQLTKSEKQLKEILIKSQLFLYTAKTLFKFNIPVNVLHGFGHNDDHIPDTKLILDCGIELLKKKEKRRELECYPSKKTTLDCAITMFRSIDELIKQLNKDLCELKSYGGKWGEECDPEENIYEMLEKDVDNKEPDKNSMWDFDWYGKSFASCEKDELIKDVEKHMLRKLLDELTRDLMIY